MDRRLPVAVALIVTLLVMIAPSRALAHTGLQHSEPTHEAVLDAAPTQVVLEFGGPVTAGPGAIQVFAPDGSRIDVGGPTPAKGRRISQRIDAQQEGTYGIAFRVSSEDGHVISEPVVTFAVGEATSGGGGGADASRDAAEVDPTLQLAFSTARFVEILALLVAAGGGMFACLVAPGWRPRLVLGSLVVLLLAYAAGFVLNAAMLQGGGLAGAFNRDVLGSAADTPFGLSLQIRAAVAAVAIPPAVLLARVGDLPAGARWSLAVVFAGLAASLSITGHAVTTSPTWLRLPLDMLHVVAAAIWIGGLVQLAFLAPHARTHLAAVTRFSRVAFASVVALLATGIYATYAELGVHPRELLDSEYGRLVVGKVVLYLGTLPLAGNNMQAFVPQLRRRPEDAPRMLRQYVWREAFLVVVVLALTVWLIATPQPS